MATVQRQIAPAVVPPVHGIRRSPPLPRRRPRRLPRRPGAARDLVGRRLRLLGGALALLLVGVGAAGSARRLLHLGPAPPPTVVEVQEGDTLWGLAERAAPGSDPRSLVDAIRARDHRVLLHPGESVEVP
jgi:DNA-binding helix-hairpin-helix protein with protein kinase domain